MKIRITKTPTNHKANGGNLQYNPYLNSNNPSNSTWLDNGGVPNSMIQLQGDKHSDPSQGIDYTPDTKVEA